MRRPDRGSAHVTPTDKVGKVLLRDKFSRKSFSDKYLNFHELSRITRKLWYF